MQCASHYDQEQGDYVTTILDFLRKYAYRAGNKKIKKNKKKNLEFEEIPVEDVL